MNDWAMTWARQIVESHIEVWGYIPHPDRLKDRLADELRQARQQGKAEALSSTKDGS